MNPTTPADRLSDVPWPTSDPRMPVPDTSMLSDGETAPAAVRPLDEGATTAEDALPAAADPWRDVQDAWMEGLRAQVRSHPLAFVAAALALGVVITRITR